MATKYRLPQQYGEVYLGFAHTWRFLIEQVLNDNVTPLDLSGYDTVWLHVYAFETSASLLVNATCPVLTGAGDLESGTQARCSITWTPTAGLGFVDSTEYKARIVGKTASTFEIFDKPWNFTAYTGGPTA